MVKKENKVYKSLSKKYPYSRGICKCGKLTTKKVGEIFLCKDCSMGLEDKLSDAEQEALELVTRSNISTEELKTLLKHKGTREEVPHKQPYSVRTTKVKFGVIGDTHIGSKFYDPKLMKEAVKVFNKEKVDFVVHGGDITEGHYENKRQGSVFELTEIGGDAQVDRAVKELSQIKQPIYAITGNHEHNTFFKLCGFDVGKQIAERLPNFHYLGNMSGTIKLPHGKKIELLHPGGGSSYAVSYRPQKIVESLEGGTKPDALFIFHYHKQGTFLYRNVHTVLGATLQSQTSFMRENGLRADKGFYVIELEVGKNGIKSFKSDFRKGY